MYMYMYMNIYIYCNFDSHSVVHLNIFL